MATNPTVERPVIRHRRRSLVELRRRQLRREQRREFGGRIQWEAVFFGLLAAIGLAASLVAMVLGGLVAAGVTSFREDAGTLVDHVMTAGGAIPVAILALAYLAGGYVAARMARFDGWRQGLGVWLLSALMLIAVAVAAWIAGGELDPTKSISLPSNPIDTGPLSRSGWAILLVALLVPLVLAIAGGVLGERFHRAVDRVTDEFNAMPAEPVDEPESDPEAETEADLHAETESDQPYGPRRESEEAPASAASSSEDSTVSPDARPKVSAAANESPAP
jgi:hypothetical protein